MTPRVASTWPKMSSHRTGWMARVTSSLGSWRTLRISTSATASVSSMKRRSGPGSAHPLGRATGASDVTVGASGVDVMAGEGHEDVVEGRVRTQVPLQVRRCPDDRDAAVDHDRDPVTQLVRFLHVVGGDDDRSEEHTSELQSRRDLVCRLLL